VADWLTARRLGRVVLAGHSSGTQVAAEAAVGHPDVAGVVLASPTVDPVARGAVRLLARWRLDGRREPPGLTESHRPEWKRAGMRRRLHTFRAHLDHAMEEPVSGLTVPLLVIRGRDDRISTPQWGGRLVELAPAGEYVEVAGAHTFPWRDPRRGRSRCAGSRPGCPWRADGGLDRARLAAARLAGADPGCGAHQRRLDGDRS
jgi:pimeloyl-ACP methyl ester carboxylesterase